MMARPERAKDKEAENFVETDPTGRYGRYRDLLGVGSVKKVYRGFDVVKGIEVAWNQIKLQIFGGDQKRLRQLYNEVNVLSSMRHDNIISLHTYWTDKETRTLNFITELCMSGNLREYRTLHPNISLKAMKRWWKQILMAIDYLHTFEPCVIHRDLNCSNVFVNGHTGQLKLGDFGLAAVLGKRHIASSLIGTPEFIAPEMYEERYTELVDIYAFGMLVLEMVTLEIPYTECECIASIYWKIKSGVPPESFAKVKDPEVKAFITRCIGKPGDRPSAAELLKDPFFDDLSGPLYPVRNKLQPENDLVPQFDYEAGVACLFLN